jgi:hypothetical protein
MFAADWVDRLNRRERYLLNLHGIGAPPQPGTLHRYDYDPFAETREGEEHGETERARDRHWLMQWQYQRIGGWLKWRGFIGRKLPRDKFDKAFAAAFPASPATHSGSVREDATIEAVESRGVRQPKAAPKSEQVQRALKAHGFDRDRQGKSYGQIAQIIGREVGMGPTAQALDAVTKDTTNNKYYDYGGCCRGVIL